MGTGTHAPVSSAVPRFPSLGTHTFVGRDRELAELESMLDGNSAI